MALTEEEIKQCNNIHEQWKEATTTMEPLDELIGKVTNHVYKHFEQYDDFTVARKSINGLSSLFGRTLSNTKSYQLFELLKIILRYKNNLANVEKLENTEHLISELETKITTLLDRIIGHVSNRQQFINEFKALLETKKQQLIDEFKASSGPGTVNQGPIGRTVFHSTVKETDGDSLNNAYEPYSKM